MIYRNIYILNHNKLPMYLFKGHSTLYYNGKIEFVKSKPDNFDKTKDLYIDCDCEFKKWHKIEKLFK